MLGENLARVAASSSAPLRPDAEFMRGLAYSLVFSIPLWGAIIALVRLVL